MKSCRRAEFSGAAKDSKSSKRPEEGRTAPRGSEKDSKSSRNSKKVEQVE
jgi:hypothetical protein